MALAMSNRRRGRWRHKAWIDVAKSAISGDHMRRAFLDTLRNSQSHTTSPAPRRTAHHGALPKLPAWLAGTPKPIAAASPAAANVDLKMDRHLAPSLSRRRTSAQEARQRRLAAATQTGRRARGRDSPDVMRGQEQHEVNPAAANKLNCSVKLLAKPPRPLWSLCIVMMTSLVDAIAASQRRLGEAGQIGGKAH